MSFLLVLQCVCVWTLFSLVLYIALLLTQDRRLKNRLSNKNSNYLLVTAHPDDECMFFGPLLTGLLNWGVRLRLLCLSAGNFYGVGNVRRHELDEAAKELGLPVDRVSLVDDPRLPDSMRDSWAVEDVLEFVNAIREKNNEKGSTNKADDDDLSMITFDPVGITRHPNHSSINRALAHSDCGKRSLVTLVSIPFFVQYTGSLTCVPILLLVWLWRTMLAKRSKNRNVFIVVASPGDWLKVIRAMLRHKSQIMWFRVLHLMLSSYLLVNVIEEDLCLDE